MDVPPLSGLNNQHPPSKPSTNGQTNHGQAHTDYLDLYPGNMELLQEPSAWECRPGQPPELRTSSHHTLWTTPSATSSGQEALYQQPLDILLEQPAPKLQTWVQHGHKYINQ